MRQPRPILFLASLAALTACGDAAGPPAAALVRDSAGVTIVESAGPAWAEGVGWTLSTEPLLEIGRAEGDDVDLLDRVTGAVRTPDGGVLLANAGSAELRYYDAEGRHLRSVGRRGDGPGEFQDLSWLHPYRGDSLAVFDPRQQRLSIFTAAGEYGRSLTLTQAQGGSMSSATAPFADGSLLARKMTMSAPGQEISNGVHGSTVTYGRFAADSGVLLDSLATLPGSDSYIIFSGNSVSIFRPQIGFDTYVATHGDELFIGNSREAEVRVHAADGTLRRILRRLGPPLPLTEADLARLSEERAARMPNDDAAKSFREAMAKIPAPEHRPAFSALLTDVAGNLWVRETILPGDPVVWNVFDTEGAMLGPVTVPEGFTPLQIGEDFVLGVLEDELGVQRARIYALEK